jgi:hypothetical protein
MNRHRIALDVSPAFRDRLDELCELFGDGKAVSLTEGIRRSVYFTKRILVHVRDGGRIILRDTSGDRESMIL